MRKAAFLLAASFLCVACQPAGDERSKSGVGADRLPSASALSREMIQINRGFGEASEGFLSLALTPDDRLTVTHTDRHADKVVGEEEFRLAPAVADRARRLLWRVRPATLEGLDAHETRPSGCKRQGPHDFGELAVTFVSEGGRPGVEDDSVGVFELPLADSCNTPQAQEARMLMQQVFASFPPSNVAAAFDRHPSK